MKIILQKKLGDSLDEKIQKQYFDDKFQFSNSYISVIKTAYDRNRPEYDEIAL